MDERYDTVRAVRDDQYRYVRNYFAPSPLGAALFVSVPGAAEHAVVARRVPGRPLQRRAGRLLETETARRVLSSVGRPVEVRNLVVERDAD